MPKIVNFVEVFEKCEKFQHHNSDFIYIYIYVCVCVCVCMCVYTYIHVAYVQWLYLYILLGEFSFLFVLHVPLADVLHKYMQNTLTMIPTC